MWLSAQGIIILFIENISRFACGYAHCNQVLIRITGVQVLYEQRNKAPHNKFQEFFYWNTIGSFLQAQLLLDHQIK